jgi:hypothetical protein
VSDAPEEVEFGDTEDDDAVDVEDDDDKTAEE